MFRTIKDIAGYDPNCEWCTHFNCRLCMYRKQPCMAHEGNKSEFKDERKSMKLTTTKKETVNLRNLVRNTYSPEGYWPQLFEVLIEKKIIDVNDLKRIIHGRYASNYSYEIEPET